VQFDAVLFLHTHDEQASVRPLPKVSLVQAVRASPLPTSTRKRSSRPRTLSCASTLLLRSLNELVTSLMRPLSTHSTMKPFTGSRGSTMVSIAPVCLEAMSSKLWK
jgi:hypothetical protein